MNHRKLRKLGVEINSQESLVEKADVVARLSEKAISRVAAVIDGKNISPEECQRYWVGGGSCKSSNNRVRLQRLPSLDGNRGKVSGGGGQSELLLPDEGGEIRTSQLRYRGREISVGNTYDHVCRGVWVYAILNVWNERLERLKGNR